MLLPYLSSSVKITSRKWVNRMLDLFAKQYGKVGQLDENSDEATDPLWMDTVQGTGRSFRATSLPWLLHLVVIAAYSIVFFVNYPKPQMCSPCFSGQHYIHCH
jgi:hypothetical protein